MSAKCSNVNVEKKVIQFWKGIFLVELCTEVLKANVYLFNYFTICGKRVIGHCAYGK